LLTAGELINSTCHHYGSNSPLSCQPQATTHKHQETLSLRCRLRTCGSEWTNQSCQPQATSSTRETHKNRSLPQPGPLAHRL